VIVTQDPFVVCTVVSTSGSFSKPILLIKEGSTGAGPHLESSETKKRTEMSRVSRTAISESTTVLLMSAMPANFAETQVKRWVGPYLVTTEEAKERVSIFGSDGAFSLRLRSLYNGHVLR